MTIANTEGIYSDKDLGVYGFLFSPDFDTSQSLNVGSFHQSIMEKECKIHKSDIKVDNWNIPVYVLGKFPHQYGENIVQMNLDKIIKDLEWKKNLSSSVEVLTNKMQGRNLSTYVLDNGTEYLGEDQDFFIIRVLTEGVIIVTLNPFNLIFKEEDFNGNNGRNLKKSFIQKYFSELTMRQLEFFEEIKDTFDKFHVKATENGLVIGNFNMFLKKGLAVFAGTKEDSINCIDKGVFPYKVDADNRLLIRRTKEEIIEIIKEEREFHEKKFIVVDKIEKIEKLLKDKGYSWTVISKNRITFKKDDNGNEYWYVWMNAQRSDGANSGWFKEQDFIDWLNMEGRIPFHRKQVYYHAKKLEELTQNNPKLSKYTLLKVVPENKKEEINYYEDYKAKAYMNVGGKKLYYHLDTIKKLIQKYSSEENKKYSKEDLF